MAEKLKEVLGKILDWWNKFTSKQKTIIVAIAAVVILTLAIIIYAFSRPQYERLGTYETSKEGAEVISILDENKIAHQESDDLRVVMVEKGKLSAAIYALAEGGYKAGALEYKDVVDTGMSITSADRANMEALWYARRIEEILGELESVKGVKAMVTRPRDFGTLYAQQEETSVSVTLTLKEPLTSAQAAAMARNVAVMVGNKTTANIAIWDQDANLLFAGGDDYSESGVAHSMQELQEQMQSMLTNEVKKVLLGTQQFDIISVASHLNIDFSSYERATQEFYGNQDNTGMVQSQDTFSSSSTGGVGGIPGTDSNGGDLTGYEYPDYGSSESEQQETSTDYALNHFEEYIKRAAGTSVDYNSSSLAISMITVREYYEENVKRQGLLDGTSWEQFKEDNRADVKREVDEAFYQMAAHATGISRDNITIIAYEHPVFWDKEGMNISATDVLSIVMIVLILALLGFVVLRSMAGRKETVEEEELSVEDMLQSNPETTIEDIDVEAKSEVRKMIEKFVDENPEAAANLLRNWLTEDWG